MTKSAPSLPRGIGGHHSPAPQTDEWLTPPAIVAALGGADAFDLDPCAPVYRPWPTARHHFTVADDGVWLNPPYSRPAFDSFMDRMVGHGRGTALIFARTETATFFRCVWRAATALLFLEGRLHFHVATDTQFPRKGKAPILVCAGGQAPANGGAPSVLCAYGRDDAERLADSGLAGQFVPLLVPRAFVVAALGNDVSWRDILLDILQGRGAALRLDDLYRRLASHPKARGRRYWREQIRKVLQEGPFRRVAPGLWEAA